MGIKGIYKEIGAGQRIALCRLAAESLESRGRPLRLAIDISIWQFQVQAARGGASPAIRTLFYRLVRLLGMPIHPVFVFDGPNKPAFKRNKRSGTGDGMATAMAKRLIRLFGFVAHDAPGEAEAECALLQQRGVVDAVLSEDVDTIMFGCTRTLRSWSAVTAARGSGSGSKGATSRPTHVSMYEAASLRQSESGLDREGMVLVALMSGGDYLPEGVPGCGVKLACEAAKAGFGRSLCRLKRSDTAGLAGWRTDLQHELRTNESRFFRTCHHKLHIPDQFPNLDILRYYTHPVVSPAEVVERVRGDLEAVEAAGVTTAMRDRRVDIVGLRDFVAETFDWRNRDGAIKFIRVLAPSLLARILLLRWSADCAEDAEGAEALDKETEDRWPSVVEGISKHRMHASTDETLELRVSFNPTTVVSFNLEAESDAPTTIFGRDGLALNSDDEFDEPSPTVADTAGTAAMACSKKAAPYDPTQPDVAWVAKAIVEIGAPRALEAWETRQQKQKQKQKQQQAKAGAKGTNGKAGGTEKSAASTGPGRRRKAGADPSMPVGALDRYVQVTKKASKDGGNKEVSRATLDMGVSSTQDDIDTGQRQLLSTSKMKPNEDFPSRDELSSGKPGSQAANPWSRTGFRAAPRITKPGGRNLQQGRSEADCTSPSKLSSSVAANVVDLLSSPEEASRLRSPTKTGRVRRAASPTGSPRKARNENVLVPGSSQAGSPPRQRSIREFLAQPVAIVLSDDEASMEEYAGGRACETHERSSPPPVFSSPIQSKAVSPAARTKTVYVLRKSAVGYFREETVDVDEDDADEKTTRSGRQRRGWRKSEVGTVDLTGLGSD